VCWGTAPLNFFWTTVGLLLNRLCPCYDLAGRDSSGIGLRSLCFTFGRVWPSFLVIDPPPGIFTHTKPFVFCGNLMVASDPSPCHILVFFFFFFFLLFLVFSALALYKWI